MADLACPPTPATDGQLAAISDVEGDVANLFRDFYVPWKVQELLCTLGYTTMNDIAERWPTKEQLRDTGARDLGLLSGDGEGVYEFGYFKEAATRALVRLSGATEEARRKVQQRSALLSSSSATAAANLITKAVSLSMETVYKQKVGRKPPLDRQGSDQLLGKAFKKVSDGYVPYFGLSEMVPFLLDEDTRLVSKTKRKRSDDGTVAEQDEEQIEEPVTRQHWTYTLEKNTVTILMAIWSNPQHANLQVSREEIDDFYIFLDGPDIGSRKPPPSIDVLMRAERAAWRKIATLVHGGLTLKEALVKIQNEALFWTREVYETIPKEEVRDQQPSGWGQPRIGSSWESQVGGKGKSKWNQKANGKGKHTPPWFEPPRAQQFSAPPPPVLLDVGPRPIDPSKWCDKDPTNKEYCRNYQHGRCRGGCRRSHRCPLRLRSNMPCNADHRSTSHDPVQAPLA